MFKLLVAKHDLKILIFKLRIYLFFVYKIFYLQLYFFEPVAWPQYN